jgi:hypothetical protein
MISKRLFGGVTLLATAALGLIAAPAHATGTIAGGDTTNRQVGNVFASCTAFLGSSDQVQSQIWFPAPGIGGVVSQAFYMGAHADALRQLLIQGWTPTAIVAEIDRVAKLPASTTNIQQLADPSQDPHGIWDANLQAHQFEILSLTAPSATWSGSSRGPGTVLDWHSEQTSSSDRFVSASAANTLTSTDFASTMTNAYQGQGDIVQVLTNLGVTVTNPDAVRKGDLAERLFLGLEAGFSRPGQGDWRCVYDHLGGSAPADGVVGTLPPFSRSSSMSWLSVVNGDGSQAMNLRYRSANIRDAARELAQLYYDCRTATSATVAQKCFANVNDETPRPSNQNFTFSFMSQAGNVVGKGQSITYTPAESKLSAGYDGRNVVVTVGSKVDTWNLQMTPPRSADWVNGKTYDIESGARNLVAAFNLTRNGVACSRPFGQITMNNIAFSGSTLTAISMDFNNVTCQGSSATIGGQLRYIG